MSLPLKTGGFKYLCFYDVINDVITQGACAESHSSLSVSFISPDESHDLIVYWMT